MPFVESDRARLYVEEVGAGYPIIFVHEFAADCREWEPQLRFFSRSYRCITYNARGYPPSEVADQVLRGVRERRFYIVPAQPEVLEAATIRARDILELRNPTPRRDPAVTPSESRRASPDSPPAPGGEPFRPEPSR